MKNGNSNVLIGVYLNVKDDEIGNMRGLYIYHEMMLAWP